MRLFQFLIIFIATSCFAMIANAGTPPLAGGPTHWQKHSAHAKQHHKKRHKHKAFTQKYTVENGVKVYRNAPGPAQQAAIDRKRQRIIHADHMRKRHALKIEAKKAKSKAKKAYKKGYKAGYHDGLHAAEARCDKCQRRRIRLRQRIRTRPIVSQDVLSRRNLQ